MTVVVGTAGHIDHGKTTLLRALTGIDPDRLPDERRRGMTIDVGYAHLTLPDGTVIDFVDVPGHDRLVGNMLVGAGEIDAALLVVAADDGPRAQTIEHLELLDALGVEDGLAVVTKIDAVDRERVRDVVREVARLVEVTSLAGSPVLAASATTGEGLDAVCEALAALHARRAVPQSSAGPSRLAIDRVFTVRGRGAVVTGTMRGNPVRRGDELRLVPGDRPVVVREVQVHGEPVAAAAPGRAAFNLRGVDASDLRRGLVLTRAAAVRASDRALVLLRPSARIAGDRALPQDAARVRLHTGTDHVDARLGRAGREATSFEDGTVTAVVRLDRPVALAPGDRFVLRRPGSRGAEAAGTVLDVDPPRGVSRRRASPSTLRALAASLGADRERLALHGAIVDGATVGLAPDVRSAVESAAVELVRAGRGGRTDPTGLPLAELRAAVAAELRSHVTLLRPAALAAATAIVDELVAAGRVARSGDRVTDAHRPADPAPDDRAIERLVAALDAAAPPPLSVAAREAACPPEDVRRAERDGRIVRLDADLAFSAGAWDRLARLALDHAREGPLTPATLRDLTRTSRKYVMALLEDLDRRGILARTPTGHVPGPRAATLDRRELVP